MTRSQFPTSAPNGNVPEWAADTAIAINNRYELGLRDKELRVLAWFIHRRAGASITSVGLNQ